MHRVSRRAKHQYKKLRIREANYIFEYTLNPIEHEDKPPVSAQLIVVK
jgi:hypothetical protein